MPFVIRIHPVKGPAKFQQHNLLAGVAILHHNGANIFYMPESKEAVAAILLLVGRCLSRIQFRRRSKTRTVHPQRVKIAIAGATHSLIHLVIEDIIRHGHIAVVTRWRHACVDHN